MKWAVGIGIIVGALAGPPSASSISLLNLIEGAAALIAIVLATVQFSRFRKLGGAQREDIEASAAQRAVDALDKALARYVVELEAATKAIGILQDQLADANTRIIRLEEALEIANGDKDRLQARLEKAYAERAKLELQMTELQGHVSDLQRRVGGRRAEDGPESTSGP